MGWFDRTRLAKTIAILKRNGKCIDGTNCHKPEIVKTISILKNGGKIGNKR